MSNGNGSAMSKAPQGEFFGSGGFASTGPRRPYRRTSSQAHESVLGDGTIGKLQKAVYDHVYKNGPLTANELNVALAKPGEKVPGYHKRLSELERIGVVTRTGARDCKVTGREAVTWDVTDSLPKKDKAPLKQRTHTVLGCGSTPEEALKAFASVLGWDVVGITVELGANGRWSATGKTADGDFKGAGLKVPGGYVLTRYE